MNKVTDSGGGKEAGATGVVDQKPWAGIVSSVKSPLGFFALAALTGNTIFGSLLVATGDVKEPHAFVLALIVLGFFFFVTLTVAYITIKMPGNWYPEIQVLKEKSRQLDDFISSGAFAGAVEAAIIANPALSARIQSMRLDPVEITRLMPGGVACPPASEGELDMSTGVEPPIPVKSEVRPPIPPPPVHFQETGELVVSEFRRQRSASRRVWLSAETIALSTGIAIADVRDHIERHPEQFEVYPITPSGFRLYFLKY